MIVVILFKNIGPSRFQILSDEFQQHLQCLIHALLPLCHTDGFIQRNLHITVIFGFVPSLIQIAAIYGDFHTVFSPVFFYQCVLDMKFSSQQRIVIFPFLKKTRL